MVGDSVNDVQAARAAGYPIAAVSYGYNQGIAIAETDPDVVIDDLQELFAVCKQSKGEWRPLLLVIVAGSDCRRANGRIDFLS